MMGDGRWEMGERGIPEGNYAIMRAPSFPFFLSLLSHKKEVRKKWKK